MPALKAAEKALEGITPKDITMIKSVLTPTVDTLMVMTTVCILMKVAPASKMNPETQKKEFDYWKPAQKMMNQADFRSKLLEYPKEEITEDLIKKLDGYLKEPNYNRDKLVTVSGTIASFGDWVMAMHKFFFVNKIVIPKKAALAQAQSDYDIVAAELKIKQASLDEIMSKVNKLKRQLQDAKDELEDLNNQLEDCKSRLIKAESLIGSLSKEKERWDQLSKDLSVDLVNLTGDVLIASGMIAYLGAFNSSYREELANEWVKGSSERKIPNSGEFSLKRVLGNAVEIRQWNLQQLPSDDFSVENAIITKTARRWPLFIDPQG
jgi:dynein heavy chain